MKAWPSVILGEVLSLVDSAVPTAELNEINLAGVYSFARGLFKRGPISPAETTYKYFNRLAPDDFVISVPKAWEGAIARVTPEFEGWFLSPVFPTFRANRDRLFPRFLEWYCRRESVWAELQSKSRGIGARRESVHPNQFLSLRIPLPPLAEQRRVVARIEELAAQIHEARALRKQAIEEAEAIGATVSAERFRKIGKSAPLGRLIADGTSISYGVLVPGPDVENGIPFVRIQDLAVSDPAERPSKRISAEVERAYGRTRLKGGEVLLAVVGATIGKIGVAPAAWAGANIARAVCRIVPSDALDRDYLVYVLQSLDVQNYFKSTTRTLAQPTLNVSQLELTRIPLPPLPDQRRIVAELDALQAEVDALKRHQAETAADLDALLPAILDRAFKGEL